MLKSSSLPSVAVVILNWNGKKYLEQFLPSVVSSTYKNFTVTVADNASTDDSIIFLQQFYPQIQILKNKVNEGFAKGYNTALKQIESDYYVLLNSDIEVDAGWMEPVIELMESNAAIAACQPKLLSYHNKKKFEYAGACGGWLDSFGYPFSRGRLFDVTEFDIGQYNDAQEVFWASGAAMFVKAEIYHTLGGLDEFFFAHQEEIDLCWRMQHAGYKIYVQPASIVYHVGGGTLPMGNANKVYLNFRNNLIMLSKNFTFWEALWKIPLRIFLDSIAAWKGLLTGRSITFFAITRAHLHYIKWLVFQKRKGLTPRKSKQKLAGVYNGLVIWQYFINKKKTFKEIINNKF